MQLSLFTILCKNSTISEQLQHHRQEQTKEIMEITGKNNLYGRLCARCISSSFVFNNKFEDVSSMDAPSVKIGESVVDVTNMYWKGEPLILTIKCPKPSPTQPDYSVSAVLNVGWKPDGNSWIRKGDYLNDTMHHIPLEVEKDSYKMNIEVIKYR